MPRRPLAGRRSGAPSRGWSFPRELEWPCGRRFVRENSPAMPCKTIQDGKPAAGPEVLDLHIELHNFRRKTNCAQHRATERFGSRDQARPQKGQIAAALRFQRPAGTRLAKARSRHSTKHRRFQRREPRGAGIVSEQGDIRALSRNRRG